MVTNDWDNFKYKVIDDISVQGKLVVGEATADLGGIILAYKAYHRSKEYKNAKKALFCSVSS